MYCTQTSGKIQVKSTKIKMLLKLERESMRNHLILCHTSLRQISLLILLEFQQIFTRFVYLPQLLQTFIFTVF